MPSVKDTELILDYIAENPDTEKAQAAKAKMGLSDNAVSAWKTVQLNPSHPKRTEVRNKIFDTVANSLPADQSGQGGASFKDRFVVQNLIDRDPILQQKYLEKQGYQTKHTNEGLLVKKPGDAQYKALDPKGLDWFDAFDIVSDVGEAVVTGLATGSKALGALAAPATAGSSLLGSSLVSGVATGAYETAKQGVANAVGA